MAEFWLICFTFDGSLSFAMIYIFPNLYQSSACQYVPWKRKNQLKIR